MANFYEDNKDMQFYLKNYVDWDKLVRLCEHDLKQKDGFTDVQEAKDFYEEILTLVGEFSADQIAPNAAAIDQKGLSFKDGDVVFPAELDSIFQQVKELELHGMSLPRELGGMNCPILVYMMTTELIARGDVSIMTHHGFHLGIAMSLYLYSIMEGSTKAEGLPPVITRTRFAKAIEEIRQGEAWGSMDITEPNAGSDMANLSAKAEQDSDGQWYVTGEKIFITSGHGKYHIVIARSEPDKDGESQGLQGLSLFLVPIYSKDASGKKVWHATVNNIESKLGHHASATCSISFNKTPAELIGERGDGFKLMLLLMNNARISVGFESLGLCESAYRLARAYAEQRPSMGKTIDRHEMIADYLDEMATDIKAIRALCVEATIHEEYSQKLAMRLKLERLTPEEQAEIEKQRKRHQRKARYYTPLLKYYASEKAIEMSKMCIQIHGGVGYTKEYGAEKLLRDSLVFTIYEGTSQIQSLMAMKDHVMDAITKPLDFATRLAAARKNALIATDSLKRRVAKVEVMCLTAIRHIVTKLAVNKVKTFGDRPWQEWSLKMLKDWDPKADFGPAMLHAERLTRMLIDAAICEVLWNQASQYQERRDVLEGFLERAEARVQYNLQLITSTGARMLGQMQEAAVAGGDASQQTTAAMH